MAGASGAMTGPAGAAALAPARPAEITTRKRLEGTRLGDAQGLLKVDAASAATSGRRSIVTRRNAMQRRKRRKRMLIAAALVLGLFPPIWAAYLIIWLVWRSRPPQKSMRRVRKAIRALEKDQTGVALKQLQEAHYLDPTNSDALYWMGMMMSQQKRYEEAAEALSLVADRVPGLPEVEAALARAYIATGEPESAVYHAQRLLDAAPHAAETRFTLADAFEAAERIDLAIETLEQAPLHKRLLTDDLLETHYRLGVLYERHGEPERALHHFKRVYARDLTYEDVRDRVRDLEASLER